VHHRAGLPVPGGQPCPRSQVRWTGEPSDVADLRHEDRREDRSDTRHVVDRVEAGMPGQGDAQRTGDRADPLCAKVE
jgi:hypothetical protein